MNSTTTNVLGAIRTYYGKWGYSPSIRDIKEIADISSTSVVKYHLQKLEHAGIIRRTPNIARSIILVKEKS